MNDLEGTDYQTWLANLKTRIRAAQAKAVITVNKELILLYWQIGRDILEKQSIEGWGAKVIDRLANDLLTAFPEISGFSSRNLKYMRAFAEAWPDNQFVQQAVAQLPWGHNLRIIQSISDRPQREWYVQAALAQGWSRQVLVHQIETQAYQRQGAAITNFEQTLPAPQAELLRDLIKDPYVLDFIMLADDAKERDLENSLIEHLQSFLLELGKGFAFVGRQYHLEVAQQDFFLDLLFYNTQLHAYVVIELKVDEFKPEYVGKMQFYLAAVDEQLKTDRDEATIGLILCKTKNGLIVEYALRDSNKPIGVAEYRVLPPELANSLPTVTQLEAELARSTFAEEPSSPDSTSRGKP